MLHRLLEVLACHVVVSAAREILADLLAGKFIEIIVFLGRHEDLDVRLLMGTVCIKEGSGDIHDGLSSPVEDQSGLLGDLLLQPDRAVPSLLQNPFQPRSRGNT